MELSGVVGKLERGEELGLRRSVGHGDVSVGTRELEEVGPL